MQNGSSKSSLMLHSVAQRASEPIQFGHQHSGDRSVGILDCARHPPKRGPIGILRRETTINEDFFDDPASIRCVAFDFRSLRVERKPMLHLHVSGTRDSTQRR
ncbi:MAG: hypothetical protein U0787_12855 [Polyangia bacterium]